MLDLECLEKGVAKVRRFSIAEYGVAKVCLLSFGVLFGAFNARKVKRNAFLLVIAFLFSAVYLMVRICFDDEDDYDYLDDDFDFDFDDEDYDEDDEECDCCSEETKGRTLADIQADAEQIVARIKSEIITPNGNGKEECPEEECKDAECEEECPCPEEET